MVQLVTFTWSMRSTHLRALNNKLHALPDMDGKKYTRVNGPLIVAKLPAANKSLYQLLKQYIKDEQDEMVHRGLTERYAIVIQHGG